MTGNVTPYINLITSEHSARPNFISMVGETSQPFADMLALMNTVTGIGGEYDLDSAVGVQLDVIGSLVGASRFVTSNVNIYDFAFDVTGLGFDQGIWQNGTIGIPDDHYRLYIKMIILNNKWNGSKIDAYGIMAILLNPFGYSIYIEDPANLTMNLGLISTTSTPDALVVAMFQAGLFDFRPLGVEILHHYTASSSERIFGFDVSSPVMGGFDTSCWALG